MVVDLVVIIFFVQIKSVLCYELSWEWRTNDIPATLCDHCTEMQHVPTWSGVDSSQPLCLCVQLLAYILKYLNANCYVGPIWTEAGEPSNVSEANKPEIWCWLYQKYQKWLLMDFISSFILHIGNGL